MVICYAIVYPCGSNEVEDAIILNLGLQGTPVPLFYEALIGDHFTSSVAPFTLGTEYYIDSICCELSCLEGFPAGPYPNAPTSDKLEVISGSCTNYTCVGTLIPCDGGTPVNIRLGFENETIHLEWLALLGQLLIFSTPGYSGTYYLSNICCYGTDQDVSTICGIDPLTLVPPPVVSENLGEGPCFEPAPPADPTCCAVLLPCDGGNPVTVYIGEDTSPEYTTWDSYVGNTITIDLPEYPGTYLVDSICCIGEGVIDPCLDSAPCLLNSVVIDLTDVTDLGAIPCPVPCYVLTNCESQQQLFTNSNLAFYVNSVITIQEYAGCWQVGLTEGCISTEEVTLITGYDDCLCCLGPEPPKYTRILPAPNRIFYKMPSQCDIKTNTQFANAYYKMFKNLKYGINSECDINTEKILIKKELADLAATYYTPACGEITPAPEPIICPDPS
jgi:hypothetical protein